MSDPLLHLARDGEPLGQWPAAEIRDLLRAGFLREDDHYWTPDMRGWELLKDWPNLHREDPQGWKHEAKGAVADVASLLARSTERLAQSARKLAESGSEQTRAASQRMLTDYLPTLKELAAEQLRTKPFMAAKHAVEDDALMTSFFGAVYDLIPTPVKRFVKEERFVDFCLSKRQELLSPPVQPPGSGSAEGAESPTSSLPWPPRYRLTHVRLLVADFELMSSWYRDQLGLGLRFMEPGIYAEFDAGPAILALFHRDFMAEAMQVTAPHEQAPTLTKPVLILNVPRVDEAYLALKERGLHFLAPPCNRPEWHIRTAHLTDPEGHLIELNSPLA